jgi:hypothetical protein
MIPRASETLLAELLRARYLYVYPGDIWWLVQKRSTLEPGGKA